jgi:SAM-dependent methyltransferase
LNALVTSDSPSYLKPYLRATRRHGAGFASLLWEDHAAQAVRFDALARLCDFDGHSIFDVGCGRGDLLEFLLAQGIRPSHYTGLEAVEALAKAAQSKRQRNCRIIRGDFVAEPSLLTTAAADVVVFSGSLNMLSSRRFYATLRAAYDAANLELAFNFLDSSELAGAAYLHWHRPRGVRQFVERLGGRVDILSDYLDGDCTVRVRKRRRGR